MTQYSRNDLNTNSMQMWMFTPPSESRDVDFRFLRPLQPTLVFATYWRFAAERQEIFFRRLRNPNPPWTNDPILQHHKFTNAYRASDRVSQYLIRNVIYAGSFSSRDLFFRILLFKIFNKIETWELLDEAFGPITLSTFSFNAYDKALSSAFEKGDRLYSAAYIMPSGGRNSDYARKHQGHLQLLKKMMRDHLSDRICDAPSMRQAFTLLRSCPSIGDFLAYQYVTDVNYSELTNFSEMEFVVPGPGAKDGIRKCFSNMGGLTEAAKAAVESFRTQFREAGWKEDVASFARMSGALSFSKEGGLSVTITYSDTGFMPTEVSLSAMRAELEAAK